MSCAVFDPSRSVHPPARISLPVIVACLCGLLLLTGGCATFHMPTPENFIKGKSSRANFRALTSEEDRLFVQHFAVLEKQNIKFWASAVRNNLVEQRGYTLVEEGEFKTDRGLVGHRFLFEISMGEVPYRYLLVVFASRSWLRQHIYTAEFLCEKKNFEKSAPAVEKALKQFQPRRGRLGERK